MVKITASRESVFKHVSEKYNKMFETKGYKMQPDNTSSPRGYDILKNGYTPGEGIPVGSYSIGQDNRGYKVDFERLQINVFDPEVFDDLHDMAEYWEETMNDSAKVKVEAELTQHYVTEKDVS